MQNAERRQAEARAKQQQRQREVGAAQQDAQERRHLLEEQKLLKLAGCTVLLQESGMGAQCTACC